MAKGHGTSRRCYRLARQLPSYELYGLASQLRRAALSVPANVAEGCGRRGKDRLRFFTMASASLCELQTLLAAAELLGYFAAAELTAARDDLGQTARLLGGLKRYALRNR